MIPPFEKSLILTGPTGSGKSALAIELADRLQAEIVSADSMTLYRGMDIGTAKPSVEERTKVPHHLVDVLDPWESANVAWWLEKAGNAVREIESRGKQALIVGGTPFYLKAVLCGLFPSPPVDADLRNRLEREAEEVGSEKFHNRLSTIDPVSASRLHPNDVRRVVRALEVWHLSGKTLSSWQKQSWWEGETPHFPEGRCVALDMPRDELYARIEKRVVSMFEAGWVEEVKSLQLLTHPLSKEASQALGYREIAEYLENKRTYEETISEIQLRTRQYAKRQLTWFRGLSGTKFLNAKLTFDCWTGKMSAS